MFDTCLTNHKKINEKRKEFQNGESKGKYAFQPLFKGVNIISETFKMERATGFEPATICLEGRDSTN